MNEPLPKDSIRFCFDVVKLYPSIPREEGMQACQNALETRTDKTVGTEEVMAMIKTVLENNVFEFDGKEYIQTEGVAIGSKLGRNFACATMRQWDEMLEQCEKQPMFYKRFINIIFHISSYSILLSSGFQAVRLSGYFKCLCAVANIHLNHQGFTW